MRIKTGNNRQAVKRMPDREKVIGLLQETAEYFRECRSNASFASKAENHFWELQNAANEAVNLLKEQEEVPKANGWISVKDRLPEKEGQYLCWFGKNTMAKGAAIATYLERWKSFGSLESLVTYPNVTHWMPIESPEEVKNWMTDREKVIETLEKAKMVIETWVPMFEQYNTPAGIDDAIFLLKEQEAVEPILEQDSMVCGVCGHEVIWQKMLGDGIWADEKLDYCPHCGRKVKWNDLGIL